MIKTQTLLCLVGLWVSFHDGGLRAEETPPAVVKPGAQWQQYRAANQEALKIKRYAIIVANNRSLDADVSPLMYADDDGIKYFELFEAVGAEVRLFSVLDPETQKRYPSMVQLARPPHRKAIMSSLLHFFSRIKNDRQRGIETHLYFIYTGHGNVGPNREGYINFIDARFRRTDLYRQIIAPSPASFNHLIIDACHAYFFIKKRGGRADKSGHYRAAVLNFLKAEELSSYPNTGVILATSQESETHEWSRWEAGIFSHELRSALLGAADINGDGLVNYHEAAAAVEAANSAIVNTRARLRVYYQPPAMQNNLPLFNTKEIHNSTGVSIPTHLSMHYYIENGRANRIADLHPSKEQTISVVLIGQSPFSIFNRKGEAVISKEHAFVSLGSVPFLPKRSTNRGDLERSFRQHLYEVPFGRGFLMGSANRLRLDAQADQGPIISAEQVETSNIAAMQSTRRPLRTLGWIGLTATLATGTASVILYVMAENAYQKYEDAQDPASAESWRLDTQEKARVGNILSVSTGIFGLATTAFFIWDYLDNKSQRSIHVGLRLSNREGLLSLKKSW